MAQGYPKLAKLMATDPCVSMFQRFTQANALNLLYLQAEICLVQDELGAIGWADSISDDPKKKKFSGSVWDLKTYLSEETGESSRQWELILKLRRLLKEYRETILQVSQIMHFPKGSAGDISFIQQWLDDKDGGDFFLPAIECNPWEENAEDLICLQGRDENADRCTQLIHNKIIPWFHSTWGHKIKQKDVEMGFYRYSDKVINGIVSATALILGTALLATSMFTLSIIKNLTTKFIVIFLYTIGFLTLLALMVKSSRIETLAAATAFAAVQAAFVGVTISQAGGPPT